MKSEPYGRPVDEPDLPSLLAATVTAVKSAGALLEADWEKAALMAAAALGYGGSVFKRLASIDSARHQLMPAFGYLRSVR